MSNLSVTLNEKIGIVENVIRGINGQIYNYEINLKVANIAEDEKMLEFNKKEMARHMKIKDGYENILKELKTLQKKEVADGTNKPESDSTKK